MKEEYIMTFESEETRERLLDNAAMELGFIVMIVSEKKK